MKKNKNLEGKSARTNMNCALFYVIRIYISLYLCKYNKDTFIKHSLFFPRFEEIPDLF